jgi:hypothetical protein
MIDHPRDARVAIECRVQLLLVPATDAPGIALRAQPGLRELANFQGLPQPETIHDAQVAAVQ